MHDTSEFCEVILSAKSVTSDACKIGSPQYSGRMVQAPDMRISMAILKFVGFPIALCLDCYPLVLDVGALPSRASLCSRKAALEICVSCFIAVLVIGQYDALGRFSYTGASDTLHFTVVGTYLASVCLDCLAKKSKTA